MKEEITTNHGRVFAFDFLRVIAVYLTFVSHTYLFHREIFSIGKWSFFFAAPAWGCMWVLYTLSGYLAGRGCARGMNQFNCVGDVFKYYYSKMIRIWLPAIGFVLLVSALSYPGFLPENPSVLWKFLFSTYRGSPGPDGISDLWFAFTVMVLYFLTPFVCFVSQRLRRTYLLLACAVCLLLGLAYRLSIQYYAKPYMTSVYLPVYGQLDFFCSGILMSFFSAKIEKEKKPQAKQRFYLKQISILLLIVVYAFGFYATWKAVACGNGKYYDGIYSFVGPTLFSMVTLLFLFSFDIRTPSSNSQDSIGKTILSFLAKYGFEFYLFHSLILAKVSPYIQGKNTLLHHILLLVTTFIISLAFSVMFHDVTITCKKRIESIYDVLQIDEPWLCCVTLFSLVSLAIVLVYLAIS